MQILKNIQNQYLIDKSLLKVCQIGKAILNPALIHRSTNKFHESRKQSTIQESFLSPKISQIEKNVLSRDICAQPWKALVKKKISANLLSSQHSGSARREVIRSILATGFVLDVAQK